MNIFRAAGLSFVCFGLLAAGSLGSAVRAAGVDDAVAYQIDVAHDGNVVTPNLYPPYTMLWSVNLGALVSYPLIADGKVFVTVGDDNSSGVALYALNAQTGAVAWGPINVTGTYRFANAAYDNHEIFVDNDDNVLSAFDDATGALLWTGQLAGQSSSDSPPTASNGVVYAAGVGSGGTLYAVSETNGGLLWSQLVANGENCAPTVSPDGVFVSYTGPQVYEFDPATGALDWHYDSGDEGGGGATAVYYNGELYSRGFFNIGTAYVHGLIFDAETGGATGTFAPGYVDDPLAPAFDGDQGFLVDDSGLSADDPLLSTPAWTFQPSGQSLVTAPLVVDGTVIVGSGLGYLYAIDEGSGQAVWSGNVGAAIDEPDEINVSQPLTGLAAGDSLLVVPAGDQLVAYTGVGPSLIGLSLAHPTAYGGSFVTATVTIDHPATEGGLTVKLKSSNIAAASVNGHVVIPEGKSSVTFGVDAKPTATPDSAVITASYNGAAMQQTLAVDPAVLAGLTLKPTSVVGGQSSTATVTLDGKPAANMVLTVTSNRSAIVVPQTVTVPAGESSAQFTITTESVTDNVYGLVSVTEGTLAGKSRRLVVTP